MAIELRKFEMTRLYQALDAERRKRGLSWAETLAQINRAFAGTSSIPISMSTLRGMLKKSSVTSAVVLQILRWMGRSPECFLAGHDGPISREPLMEPGPGRVLRFDTVEIYAALDEERKKRGLSWTQVAGELPGFTPSMLRNLAKGPLIGFPRVMLLTQWVDRPAASFIHVFDW